VTGADARIARRLAIRGRVQGVGYRVWLRDVATARGLHGWVRNRRDGSVEAAVCGEPAAIESLIAAAHVGPALARVTHVDVDVVAVFETPADVEIRATA
jgi:acylphosphatase